MGLFNFLTGGQKARQLAELSSAVAVRSRESVAMLVRDQATTMRSAEARGYTRARARQCVERHADVVLKGYPELTANPRTQVIDAALDQVVSMVLRELASLPVRTPARRAA